MKFIYTFLLFNLIVLIGCKNKELINKKNNSTHFYVGTYTDKIKESKSQGIYQYQLSTDGKLDSITLAVKTNNPSFLTKSIDKKYIIATNSIDNGSITSFLIQNKNLKKINSSKTNRNPCYVTTNKNNYVLTANYSSGTTNLHELKDGVLSDILDIQENKITIPSNHPRQNSAHSHSCYFEPNSNNIITIDLGANKLIFGSIDSISKKIVVNKFKELQMPIGAGPRILTFHPTQPWFYVVNELDATVSFVKKNLQNNTYQIIETVETLSQDLKKGNTAAHIEISKDGKYIYMTNRGNDTVGVLEVSESGKLTLIQTISTHGKHPRNFVLSPDDKFVLVANRDSNNICSFKRNQKNGKLTFVSEVNAPKPVCLIF